jgi:hypothetical protein
VASATHTKFIKVRGGEYREYPVVASQDIRRGDIVSLDAAGKITQAIALPGANNTGTASGGNLPIVGWADDDFTADASGVSTDGQSRTVIGVHLFSPNSQGVSEISMRIYNATAADSQQQDVVRGTAYQFQRWRGAGAGIWWYELITTTTNGELEVVEYNAESALTDSYGIVWVRPVLSATVRQIA